MAAALSDPRHGRGAHPLRHAVVAVLAALILFLHPSEARSQAPIVAKTLLCEASSALCDGNVALLTVPVGLPVYFQVTVDNAGSPAATKVDIDSHLPAGFLLTSVACTTSPGNPGQAVPFGAKLDDLDLPANGILVCRFSGFFGAGSTAQGDISPTVNDNATGPVVSSGWNAQVLLGAIPADLEIVKTVAPASVDLASGSKQVVFTILVTNRGAKDVALNGLLTVMDALRLKAQSVVLNATFLGATCTVHTDAANAGLPISDCLETVPFSPSAVPPPLLVASLTPAHFAGWRYKPPVAGQQPIAGLLRVGDSMELRVTVEIAAVPDAPCIIAANSDGLINVAAIVLGLPSAPGGPGAPLAETGGLLDGNNSASAAVAAQTGATVVDPNCNAKFAPVPPEPPVLTIVKTQITPTPAGGMPWGTAVTYRITIKNVSTNRHVRRIFISDWIREGIGTPPFTATVKVTCPSPTPSVLICTNPQTTSPQTLTGYSDTKQVYKATAWPFAGGLNPNGELVFDVVASYSAPRCDSYPSVNPKPIANTALVTGWIESAVNTGANPKPVTQTLTSTVVTSMAAPPEVCPLTVLKEVDPAPIEFGKPVKYTITFANPSAASQTMGTLVDGIRFIPSPANAPPYAAFLPVGYSYTCTPWPQPSSVTGYPATNPGGAGVTDTKLVTSPPFAQQGVRLIENTAPGGVVFDPGSKLVCVLYVTVQGPPSEDYCSTAQLENFALLDSSALYPPNSLWPKTLPGMSFAVRNDLPRCYDLKLDKTVVPSWTWMGGGPLVWTLKIRNIGPAIAETLNTGPLIRDTFTTIPATLGPVQPTAVVTCPFVPCSILSTQPPPSPNGSFLRIGSMAKNITAVVTYTLKPAPNGTGLVCNRAAGDYAATHPRWYWRRPNAQAAEACAKILAVGSVQIAKVVKDETGSSGIVLPATQSFDVTLHCTYPPDLAGVVIPDVTRTVAASATTLVEHVPVDSQCSVKEAPPSLPAETAKCFPVWQTDYSTSSVTVPHLPAIAPVTVTNILKCRPTTLTIVKTIDRPGHLAPPPDQASFLVNCGPLFMQVVQANTDGTPKTVVVPAPGSCTVTEYVPVSETGNCIYSVTQSPAGAVTLTAGAAVTIKFHNKLVCGSWSINGHSLAIRKLVRINGAAVPVSPALLPFAGTAGFAVEVACTGYPTVRVVLDASRGFVRIVGVYAPGTACSIREVIRANPHACSWVPPYPPNQSATVGGAPVYRDFINSITCPP